MHYRHLISNDIIMLFVYTEKFKTRLKIFFFHSQSVSRVVVLMNIIKMFERFYTKLIKCQKN